MGLYDGASPKSEEGSTAQRSRKWLGAPVIAVVDASGMARSWPPLARGCARSIAALDVAGVFANRVGSRGHLDLLAAALQPAPAVVGGLPRRTRARRSPSATSGLPPRREYGADAADRWGAPLAEWSDLDAHDAPSRERRSRPALAMSSLVARPPRRRRRCRIAHRPRRRVPLLLRRQPAPPRVARRRAGPLLADRAMRACPPLDGIYLGGGYPELHAAALAANAAMRSAPRRVRCAAGAHLRRMRRPHVPRRRHPHASTARAHPMVGLVAGDAVMADRLQALGYVEVETQADTPVRRRRHCAFAVTSSATRRWREPDGDGAPAYTVRRRRGDEPRPKARAPATTSSACYVHAHWASNPLVAAGFVTSCRRAAVEPGAAG